MPDKRPLLGDPRTRAQEEFTFEVVHTERRLTGRVLRKSVEDVLVAVELVHSHASVDRVRILLVENDC